MTPKKIFFILLVSNLLVLAGSVYGFVLARDALREDINDITEKKLQVELADGELRQLRETSQLYDEYSYLQASLDEILPQDKEQSEAIQRVVRLFNEAGVPISGINFLGTDGAPSDESQTQDSGINGVASLPIDVVVPDPISYDRALLLLKILESSGRHLNVESFGMTSASGDTVPDGSVNLSVSIDLQLRTTEKGASQ